jgi:polar amino acid transport system substrate-binding protein
MYDGYIHEDGTPAQIFEAPVHSATKAFIQRIRKEVFEIDGPDFDFLGMHSAISAFCHKYGISEKEETVHRLTSRMLDDVMAQYRFVRTFSNPVQNFNDATIYRMTARYRRRITDTETM